MKGIWKTNWNVCKLYGELFKGFVTEYKMENRNRNYETVILQFSFAFGFIVYELFMDLIDYFCLGRVCMNLRSLLGCGQ